MPTAFADLAIALTDKGKILAARIDFNQADDLRHAIQRWVGLGVIADNIIHIGDHLTAQKAS
jgi:hypothetical protein